MEITYTDVELYELEITPNQLYLINIIEQKNKKNFNKLIEIDGISKIKNDLFLLYKKGYIKNEISESCIFEFEELTIDKSKLKKNNEEEFDKFAKQLYELFPIGIYSGNSPVRSGFKNFSKKLKEYTKRNKHHTKEIILEATKRYIEKCKRNEWKFIKQAGYFIYKHDTKGAYNSTLESYCEEYINSLNNSKENNEYESGTFISI